MPIKITDFIIRENEHNFVICININLNVIQQYSVYIRELNYLKNKYLQCGEMVEEIA